MDQKLAEVIAIIESSGLHYAAKFETHLFWSWNNVAQTPGQRAVIAAVKSANGNCDDDTAKMIACTSWGYYQLLGENIWVDAETQSVTLSDYLCDVDGIQNRCLAKFLTQKGINYTLQDILNSPDLMTTFVTKYNGPGNVAAYSAKIKLAAAHLFPSNMTQVSQ